MLLNLYRVLSTVTEIPSDNVAVKVGEWFPFTAPIPWALQWNIYLVTPLGDKQFPSLFGTLLPLYLMRRYVMSTVELRFY